MNVELEKGQHYNEGKIFPFVLKCPEKPEKEWQIIDTQIYIECRILYQDFFFFKIDKIGL